MGEAISIFMTPEQYVSKFLDEAHGFTRVPDDKSLAEILAKHIRVAIRQAVLEEREACAKIVDDADRGRVLPANGVAHFIRSRP